MFLPVSEKYYDEFDSITIKKSGYGLRVASFAVRVSRFELRAVIFRFLMIAQSDLQTPKPVTRITQPKYTSAGLKDDLMTINIRVYTITVFNPAFEYVHRQRVFKVLLDYPL